MRRLSGLDAAFLALETPTSTGHVGGLSILDTADLDPPLDLARFTALLERRLPAVEVMRQRVVQVPFGIDHPVWVDDEHFDIGYHVRELALPSPGSDAQLDEQVARIHARPLDLARPPWEVYLISGLEGGRSAVYTKLHHAAMDGVSGAELLAALYDVSPQGRPSDADPVEPFEPRPAPGALGLGARGLLRLAGRPADAARLALTTARAVPQLASVAGPILGRLTGARGDDGRVVRASPLLAPSTPLDAPISPHRRFARIGLDLASIKAVKNAYGTSVNDVVLAVTAGALRRWLIEHDALPDDPLVAMCPVSLRSGSTLEGNQVSMMLAALPTQLDDPVARLREAHRSTLIARREQASVPPELIDGVYGFGLPVFFGPITRLLFRSHLMHRVRLFNVVVSNVPGPDIPIYVAGAPMLAHHPLSAVVDGVGLNVTLVRYRGSLDVGLVAAREVVPDLDALATWMGEELELLVGGLPTGGTGDDGRLRG